jgi:hypothetical protein
MSPARPRRCRAMAAAAIGTVLWVCVLSPLPCCSGCSPPGPLRLRGGRSPRSMPALAERRSRRAMGAPSSSSPEPPLHAQADLVSGADESEVDEELQSTEGHGDIDDESRSGTRIQDWDASSHGSDASEAGQSSDEDDASEFVMRLRRSSSPQGMHAKRALYKSPITLERDLLTQAYLTLPSRLAHCHAHSARRLLPLGERGGGGHR